MKWTPLTISRGCRVVAGIGTRVFCTLVLWANADLVPAIVLGADDGAAEIGHDEDLKAHFLREAPQAWARYLERVQTLRGKFAVTYSPAADKPAKTSQFEFALNGEFVQETQLMRPEQPDSPVLITAKNTEYAFAILGQTNRGAYTIQLLERIGDDPKKDEEIERRTLDASFAAILPVWLFSKSMADRLQDPNFVITKVAHDQSQGEKLVRVDYEIEPTPVKSGSEKPPILEQYILFDPGNYWVVREFRRRQAGETGLHMVYEYQKLDDGFPTLARKTSKTRYDGGESEHTTEIEELTFEQTPKSEFYLSHYGLPEPVFEERSILGTVAIYVTLGVACLGGAYFMWRRRRTAN